MISLSLVIPTFNRNLLLTETINSVLNGSVLPDEIIIVDNGIEKPDLPSNELIRYFKITPYAGVSQARNFGISIAKGNYIMFLDDDDLHEINTIKNTIDELAEFNPDVLLLKMKSYETGNIIENKSMCIKSNQLLLKDLWHRNPGIVGSNTVLKKDLFFVSNNKGYDPYLTTGQDKSIVIDLILSKNEILIIRSKAFFLYRNHNLTIRNANISNLIIGKRRFLKKYKSHMPRKYLWINKMKIMKLRLLNLKRKKQNE